MFSILDYAYVKSCEGQWFECNDTQCLGIPESQVVVSVMCMVVCYIIL